MAGFRFISILVAVFLAVCLTACVGPRQLTKTEKIEVKEEQTKQGPKLIVEKTEAIAEVNVIEKSTNVKTVTRITPFDEKDQAKKTVEKFDISPDGQRIVMVIFEEKGKKTFAQLWSTTRAGGAMTKVTSENYMDVDPSFSGDGAFIYFASDRGDERPKLWRIQSDGLGGLTKVTSGSTLDRVPYSAPSSEQIVYNSQMAVTGQWQIWRVNANGSLPTQMTLGETPVVSPDGKRILFSRLNENRKYDLWVMDYDGANQTQLTHGDANNIHGRWDPSGKYIVFASDGARDEFKNYNFDVYTIGADGTNRTQLTTNGSWDAFPVFDPKGEFIYFLSNRGGIWNIWRMEPSIRFGAPRPDAAASKPPAPKPASQAEAAPQPAANADAQKPKAEPAVAVDAEKSRIEAEKNRIEDERRKLEDERRKAKEELESARAEAEKIRAESKAAVEAQKQAELRKLEEDRKKAQEELAKARAEAERLRAEANAAAEASRKVSAEKANAAEAGAPAAAEARATEPTAPENASPPPRAAP